MIPRPLAATVLTLALAAAACDRGDATALTDAGNLDFPIGTDTFHVSSGGARTISGILNLFLTDQPDTCLATVAVPRNRSATFTLRVAPDAGGKSAATVVALKPLPGAGEAVGGVSWQVSGTSDLSYEAADGTVSWTANGDGSARIDGLDVGFKGASGRLTLAGWTVPSCQ